MTILFLLFGVVNALAFVSAPAATARVLGMLVLLIFGAALLWRESR